jgi:peroxiredoxin
MNRLASYSLFSLSLLLMAPALQAAAIVGQPAPPLSLPAADGQTVALDAYKGKVVVLEWVNFDCPFVGKHYASGHMQKLQKAYTGKGVVWLSVNSSAPGKEGHLEGAAAAAAVKSKGAAPTAFLLDPTGAAGRSYGAKTTPHVYVIDGKGTVLYNGAIDDMPSTDEADVAKARNYLSAALDETLAGKKVTTAVTQPYGCAVKY